MIIIYEYIFIQLNAIVLKNYVDLKPIKYFIMQLNNIVRVRNMFFTYMIVYERNIVVFIKVISEVL